MLGAVKGYRGEAWRVHRPQVVRCLVALTALWVAALPAAQAPATGSVVGIVSDPTGGSLPGVTVIATGNAGEVARRAVTDEQGRYRFEGLPSGSYHLSFQLAGFVGEERTVTIGAAGTAPPQSLHVSVHVTLHVGCIEEVRVLLPLDQAVTLYDAALHVRIESRGAPVAWPSRPGCTFVGSAFGATVLRDFSLWPTVPRQSGSLSIVGGIGVTLRPGDEVLLWLTWSDLLDRFVIHELDWVRVQGGRLRTDHPSFKVLDGLTIDDAERLVRRLAPVR